MAALDKIFELPTRSPTWRDRHGASILEGIRGEIDFEHVSSPTGRADAPWCTDVTCTSRPATRCAWVAADGAGKFRRAPSLVARFYDPT